jgi:hypothetical protein
MNTAMSPPSGAASVGTASRLLGSRVVRFPFVPLVATWIAIMAGCSCVRGSGVVEHREFALRDFDAVVLDGGPPVEVTIGEDFSVVGDVDSNYWPLLEITTVGRTLRIDREDGGFIHITSSKIRITMPELKRLATESPDVAVEGLAGGELDLHVGFLGEARLAGRLDVLRVRTESAVDASDLTVRNAEVVMRGDEVRLGPVTERLDASGTGTLVLNGTPASAAIDPEIHVERVAAEHAAEER